MTTELISKTFVNEKVESTASNVEPQLQDSFQEPKSIVNHGEKKKENHQHHRRKPSKKKRKWKPYTKMSWEEKKAVEERETARADRIRGEMLNRGRPVAPYNTTQFLMAEHDPYEDEPVINSDLQNSENSKDQLLNEESVDESIEAEYTDSPHMAPEFISQDFSEAYERVQEENLSTMTRDDLVKEHLSLERTLTYLQGKLAEEKTLNNSYSIKVQNIEDELDKLRGENDRLMRENVRLRFGDDAASNLENGAEQTSDYEYEVPLSDNDRLKHSGDYNEVEKRQVDSVTMDNGEGSGSSVASERPLVAGSYEHEGFESDGYEKLSEDDRSRQKRRRQARNRRSCRVEGDDDANCSYEDAERSCNGDDVPSPARYAHLNSDLPTDAAVDDGGRVANTISSSSIDINDESMQSLATPADSMDGESYPVDGRSNSVAMQSLSSES